MLELYERLVTRLREIWDGMTLNQKVVTGGAMVALLIAAMIISTLGDRMIQYTVLFAQLDARSASEITTRLDQRNIPYRIVQGGTAIEVPIGEADRLKIELTAEGLPESGIVVYEILDATNFGISDFLQKVNYKRALEGELAKTLRTFDEINSARVHIVIPEKSLYTEDIQQPTASVVLDLRRSLPTGSVEAITNLVASAAVAGLDPMNVKILDTGGALLTRPDMDELAMESSTIMELKFSYERSMASKVKSLLDGAFGSGISLVTVEADLDFDRIERMTTTYDQDRSAVLSEERTETTNPTAEGGGDETTITNYNTGQIVENLVRAPGSSVERLSVTVMIDDRLAEQEGDDGETVQERVPWSEEDIARMRALSETAVGYDETRGDRLEIENFSFISQEPEVVVGGFALQATIVESVRALAMVAAIMLGLAVFYLLARSIANMLDPARVRMAAEAEFESHVPEIAEDLETPSERSDIVRKIKTRAKRDPETTAKTIKTLFRESI